jgi:hypothetical protein
MPGMTKEDIDSIFIYHPPTEAQALIYVEIRKAARNLALDILQWVPASAEQTLAIRHLQQAVMFANAGVAIHGEQADG